MRIIVHQPLAGYDRKGIKRRAMCKLEIGAGEAALGGAAPMRGFNRVLFQKKRRSALACSDRGESVASATRCCVCVRSVSKEKCSPRPLPSAKNASSSSLQNLWELQTSASLAKNRKHIIVHAIMKLGFCLLTSYSAPSSAADLHMLCCGADSVG